MIEPTTYDPAWIHDPELAARVAAPEPEDMAEEREERDRAAFERGQTVEPPTLRVVDEAVDPRDDPDFEEGDVDLERIAANEKAAAVPSAGATGPAAESDRLFRTAAEQEPDDWPEAPDGAAYHGILGDITRAVEEHTEADPVGVLGTLLTMFGSACGGSRWLYQGSMQRTNLSMLPVGDTALGRKGTALSIARAAFRLVDPALEDLWLPGIASGEGLAGHIQRLQGEHPDEERVLVVEPEFGRLLSVMNREGSTLSPILRNAWDGVPLGHSRARDESLVTRHHVSLIGHITPPELRAKLSDADGANGFANRVLFLAVRRPRLIPFPGSPDGFVQPYVVHLRRAVDAAHRPAEMVFDQDARERWEAFYFELALMPRLGLSGAITGRQEAQVARLALVYALADGSDGIGADHLEAAIAFADYAKRSAIWAVGSSTGNRHSDALLRLLADGEVPWNDAKHALGMRTAADMAEVVAVLTIAGLAEVATVPRDGGGRPRRVIRGKGAKGAKAQGGTHPEERRIST
ncbi:MAG: DUF3987 domain-containing protein [Chloroflexota bacterium]